jgi:hypothetical protein
MEETETVYWIVIPWDISFTPVQMAVQTRSSYSFATHISLHNEMIEK